MFISAGDRLALQHIHRSPTTLFVFVLVSTAKKDFKLKITLSFVVLYFGEPELCNRGAVGHTKDTVAMIVARASVIAPISHYTYCQLVLSVHDIYKILFIKNLRLKSVKKKYTSLVY